MTHGIGFHLVYISKTEHTALHALPNESRLQNTGLRQLLNQVPFNSHIQIDIAHPHPSVRLVGQMHWRLPSSKTGV